jgi:hypothetical protein
MAYGYDERRDRVYPVEAARSASAYEDYWRALDIGDDEGADEVQARGQTAKVAPKTGLLVLEVEKYPDEDPRPDCAVVRVQDGPLKGAKFYLAVFHVCRLMENPYFDPPGTPMPTATAAPGPSAAGTPRRKTMDEMTPEEIRAVRAGAARQMADSYLNIAENLRKSGKYAAARRQYQEVIRDFGSHPEAKTAKERLRTLPKE